jgi:hypothetical protein
MDKPCALDQEFVQVMVVEASVALASEPHDLGSDPVRDPVGGRPSAIPMHEGGHAPDTKGGAQSADLANRSPQECGGLGHHQLPTIKGVEDLQALLGAVRQGNHASPTSVQPGEDIFADPLGRTKSPTYHMARFYGYLSSHR